MGRRAGEGRVGEVVAPRGPRPGPGDDLLEEEGGWRGNPVNARRLPGAAPTGTSDIFRLPLEMAAQIHTGTPQLRVQVLDRQVGITGPRAHVSESPASDWIARVTV